MVHRCESVKLPMGFAGVQSIAQDVAAVRIAGLHSNIAQKLGLSSGGFTTISSLLGSSQGKPKHSLFAGPAAITLVSEVLSRSLGYLVA